MAEDEIFRMNKMRREASMVRSCGSSSIEGFSQGKKCGQRSGKETREQVGFSNIGTGGRNWEGVSKAKDVVPHKKTSRARTGDGARKMKAQPDLFQQIQHKLRSLEEDMWLLKKVFLRRVQERAVLMNEVVQQFHMITERLGSPKTNGKSLRDRSFAIPHKVGNKNIGLSEILHQDFAPSVVTRDMRVNMNTFQVLA